MVDLLAGARISGRAWMEKSNIRVASHAGLGVLLSTSEERVIVKAMKPGLPAYLSGAVAHGDALVEINGRLVFVRCRIGIRYIRYISNSYTSKRIPHVHTHTAWTYTLRHAIGMLRTSHSSGV
jgi:hypothetical protein